MRINLLGGPGSGKSTTAAWLFSELKRLNVSIELATEYVKFWAISKRPVNEFDQIYLFGKQMHYEYRFLNSGIKNIVTDSPVVLSAIYADLYYKEIDIAKNILNIEKEYEKKHPSFNIFLRRGDKPYHQEGRYQTKEQSVEIDGIIENFLKNSDKDVSYIDYNNREEVLKQVLEKIDK